MRNIIKLALVDCLASLRLRLLQNPRLKRYV